MVEKIRTTVSELEGIHDNINKVFQNGVVEGLTRRPDPQIPIKPAMDRLPTTSHSQG